VAAFVGDALGDALTNCKGSQDSLVPDAAAAAAPPVMAATTPPEAAVSRALPAIKVTARRRPCAIRVPAQSVQYYREIGHLPVKSYIGVFN
jgi:carboxypeptidase C (cathepsin A)